MIHKKTSKICLTMKKQYYILVQTVPRANHWNGVYDMILFIIKQKHCTNSDQWFISRGTNFLKKKKQENIHTNMAITSWMRLLIEYKSDI